MHKAIYAYVMIDTIVRENGIEPIEEGMGASLRTELKKVSFKNPPGFSLFARAIDFAETGYEFNWSFEIFKVNRAGKLDAVAVLSSGAEVDERSTDPDAEGTSFYPSLDITYRASSDAWTVEFNDTECPWSRGEGVATAAKLLGLKPGDSDDGSGRVAGKVLTEAEAREAIAKLAKFVKENCLD